jgi:hypothetical protein
MALECSCSAVFGSRQRPRCNAECICQSQNQSRIVGQGCCLEMKVAIQEWRDEGDVFDGADGEDERGIFGNVVCISLSRLNSCLPGTTSIQWCTG